MSLGLGFDSRVFAYPTATDANLPAAAGPPFGIPAYHRMCLEGYTQIRHHVYVLDASSSGTSFLQAQYTLDLTGAAGWVDVVGANIPLNVVGVFLSAWGAIPAPAKQAAEVLLRLITQNGAGAGDSTTMLSFRIDMR